MKDDYEGDVQAENLTPITWLRNKLELTHIYYKLTSNSKSNNILGGNCKEFLCHFVDNEGTRIAGIPEGTIPLIKWQGSKADLGRIYWALVEAECINISGRAFAAHFFSSKDGTLMKTDFKENLTKKQKEKPGMLSKNQLVLQTQNYIRSITKTKQNNSDGIT